MVKYDILSFLYIYLYLIIAHKSDPSTDVYVL